MTPALGCMAPVGGCKAGRIALRPCRAANLCRQLLHLLSQRTDLHFDAIDARLIAAAAVRGRTIGGGGGRSRRLGKRFERADDDLEIDKLLFELLDALAQGSIRAAGSGRGRGGVSLGGVRVERCAAVAGGAG